MDSNINDVSHRRRADALAVSGLNLPGDESLYRAWPTLGFDDEETRMARPAELARIRSRYLAA